MVNCIGSATKEAEYTTHERETHLPLALDSLGSLVPLLLHSACRASAGLFSRRSGVAGLVLGDLRPLRAFLLRGAGRLSSLVNGDIGSSLRAADGRFMCNIDATCDLATHGAVCLRGLVDGGPGSILRAAFDGCVLEGTYIPW